MPPGPARGCSWARPFSTRTEDAAFDRIDVRQGSEQLSLDVDALAVSGGWNPQIALTTHLGAKPRWSDELSTFVPDTLPPGMRVVGAADGAFTLAAALRGGERAGREAAHELGFASAAEALPAAGDEPAGISALWHVQGSRGKAFVDLQNDVTAKDVEVAYREGFRSVEHLKRYTTLGMATDQGKTSNVNGHAMMAGPDAAQHPADRDDGFARAPSAGLDRGPGRFPRGPALQGDALRRRPRLGRCATAP